MRLLLFNLATDADDPILGFTTRWIQALAKQVEFIHVVTMRVGRVEVPENVRVYSVGKEKSYTEPHRAVEFYRHLLHILQKDRIDVCFSHMIPIFTILAGPILKIKRIPIVTWFAHRQVTRVLKLAHHLSDRIVSINEESYRYRHDKFIPLGHGIDTDFFSPNDTAPASPPLLLSVGRISPIKDPITLIEAVHLLQQRGFTLRCIFVGDAPERDRAYSLVVRNRVKELGLENSVQFAGAVSNYDVVHWYRRCFAHVNCSPSDHSLDKVVLEAMACGKPSLSSTLGFNDTMGDWISWLLFQYNDPKDLAIRLKWILSLHKNDKVNIGIYLREQVILMHSLEQLVGRLCDIFKSIQRG